MSQRGGPIHSPASARPAVVHSSEHVLLGGLEPVFTTPQSSNPKSWTLNSAVTALQDLLCLVQELLAGDLWYAIADPDQAAGLRWRSR